MDKLLLTNSSEARLTTQLAPFHTRFQHQEGRAGLTEEIQMCSFR